MELLTYSEAAALTGLTNKTLQRHVKKGLLQAVETPVGKRLSRESLTPYLGLRRDNEEQGRTGTLRSSDPQAEPLDLAQETLAGTGKPSAATDGLSVPLSAHLAALDLARVQLEHLQRQAEEAQRQVLSAERAKMSLEVQLGQYQRVLAEQAESLAEERAKRLTLEAKGVTPELPAVELKMDTTASQGGWGQRVKRWLRWERTG